jgi:hypothetical protein
MSVIGGFNLAGKIGKSLGYVMWAINSAFTLAGRFGRTMYDKATDKPKYDVTVHVQGVELSVKRSIYLSEVTKLVEAMRVIDAVEINVKLAESDVFQD